LPSFPRRSGFRLGRGHPRRVEDYQRVQVSRKNDEGPATITEKPSSMVNGPWSLAQRH
jgi:hypothetical protein